MRGRGGSRSEGKKKRTESTDKERRSERGVGERVVGLWMKDRLREKVYEGRAKKKEKRETSQDKRDTYRKSSVRFETETFFCLRASVHICLHRSFQQFDISGFSNEKQKPTWFMPDPN